MERRREFDWKPVACVVGTSESGRRWCGKVAGAGYDAGYVAGRSGFTVMTGGLSGVMSVALAGARAAEVTTIGVLPGRDKTEATQHADIILPTGLGIGRNYWTAMFCDVMIALPGGLGTLQEVTFALELGREVFDMGFDCGIEGVVQVGGIEELKFKLTDWRARHGYR